MNLIRKKLIVTLALLVLLSASHLASAYYDPGVQRWINRDPVNELGHRLLADDRIAGAVPYRAEEINLYECLSNDPVDTIDPYGEILPIIIIIVTGILIGYFLQEGCHPEEKDWHDEEPNPDTPDGPPGGRRGPPPRRIHPRGEPPPGRPPRAP